MNAEQKRAWLGVATGVLCLLGFVALLPMLGPGPATAAFALFGVNGLSPLLFRREETDERDRAIARRATLGGAMASYCAFVLGCMGTWFVVFGALGRESVPVHLLPQITILGLVVLWVVRSLLVLRGYAGAGGGGDA
jgi:hypothetical protein